MGISNPSANTIESLGLEVPAKDAVVNADVSDVVGNKTDSTSGTSLVSLVKTADGVIDAVKVKTDALPESIWTSTMNAIPTPGTRECSLILGGGNAVVNNVTISGNGAQTKNLFSFTGMIDIKEIKLKIGTVTSSTTFSNVRFVAYDGTNTVELTTTVNCSGTVAGSEIFKADGAASAATHLKADQVRIKESAFNRPFVEVLVNAKAGVTNYLRLTFTGDANTSIAATACVIYEPVSDDASVTAV